VRTLAITLVAGLALAGSAQAERTVLIGDSLAVRTAPYLPRIEVHAKEGQKLAWGVQWLRPADRIVWNLGTNDGLWGHLTVRKMRRYVDRVLRYAPCVVVPTMFAEHFGWFRHDYRTVNRYLRHDRRIVVADWATWMWQHPEHQGDGVHSDPDGLRARANLIDDALARC